MASITDMLIDKDKKRCFKAKGPISIFMNTKTNGKNDLPDPIELGNKPKNI